jgi:cytochrome bd ubiquinol oxidase subunit II
MENIWFCLVAVMVALYVVFDGYDLGAGILHLWVARSDAERRQVLGSIGPVWDGNEVWLLAGGGTLYFAFPALYAAGFSGFYLPLMMVLWLLILRAISIEFRNHIETPVWRPFWDATFSLSSLLLSIFLGAALGNVVRGVPLDAEGYFFEPLWTNFQLGQETGVLDWYTILIGVASLVALAMHGALWLALKTTDAVQQRSWNLARWAWYLLASLTVLITLVTFQVQPHVPRQLAANLWGCIFPALALLGLGAMFWFIRRKAELQAFLASCAYLLGMLTSAVFGLYPYVLPSNSNPELSLTVQNAAAPAYGLQVGIYWWVVGMALATGYIIYVHRRFRGKVALGESGY